MSYMSQLKKKLSYEPEAPRCQNCLHYRQSFIKMTTYSKTKRVNTQCGAYSFTISGNGLCDKWVSKKDGAVLDI